MSSVISSGVFSDTSALFACIKPDPNAPDACTREDMAPQLVELYRPASVSAELGAQLIRKVVAEAEQFQKNHQNARGHLCHRQCVAWS